MYIDSCFWAKEMRNGRYHRRKPAGFNHFGDLSEHDHSIINNATLDILPHLKQVINFVDIGRRSTEKREEILKTLSFMMFFPQF